MPGEHALRPLVVDLDGALLKTNLLAEAATAFLVRAPLRLPRLFGWLAQGRPELIENVAKAGLLDVTVLPYNEELLARLRVEKARGRTLVLATAAPRCIADAVAGHLRLFDRVLAAPDGRAPSSARRETLDGLYGRQGYDCAERSTSGAAAGRQAAALLRAMRPHQWLKNLLLLVPLLAAHRYGDAGSVLQALVAFVAFAMAASSVYVLNDLVDVTADRHHPTKRRRPFAAGELSPQHGWLAWPLLLLAACALALAALPPQFARLLLLYVVCSSLYSLWLKQVPVLDVLLLAGLYTVRIVAGAAAIDVPISFWLLSFSMFFFVSLAFIKRYGELKAAREAEQSGALRGRGYAAEDLEVVSSLGGASGHVAVLVLALYIHDAHTSALYSEPRFIWLACPLMLYWISRAWLIAHRGQMHDDPILFALKDRVSWMVAGLLAAVFVLARVAA